MATVTIRPPGAIATRRKYKTAVRPSAAEPGRYLTEALGAMDALDEAAALGVA